MRRTSALVRTRSRLVCALALTTASALGGCSHDLVLPDREPPSTCGDGIVESDEQCDVDSPGCIACVLQPDWTCTTKGCSQLCVDGGPDCGAPQRENACDLTGFWGRARDNVPARDMVLQSVQVSSQWYLYEIAQEGADFSLAASLDCGVHVSGIATIDYPPQTARALVWLNPMDGTDSARGKRTGTSKESAKGCDVTLGPWYFVRGVTTSYLPPDFASDPPLDTLEPLPSVADPVNGNVFPAGATATTTAGIPGVGFVISGFVPGIRYSAQRSTAAFATTSSLKVGATELVIPGTFNVQENVLRVTECGMECALLTTIAVPATDIPPHTTLSFLGKTLTSALVSTIVVGPPRTDIDNDLQTCANIQAFLPHDGTGSEMKPPLDHEGAHSSLPRSPRSSSRASPGRRTRRRSSSCWAPSVDNGGMQGVVSGAGAAIHLLQPGAAGGCRREHPLRVRAHVRTGRRHAVRAHRG